NASAMSPSSGNSTASPPLPMVQAPSNLEFSAGADYKSRDLGKKEEIVSASTAAAAPPAPAAVPALALGSAFPPTHRRGLSELLVLQGNFGFQLERGQRPFYPRQSNTDYGRGNI